MRNVPLGSNEKVEIHLPEVDALASSIVSIVRMPDEEKQKVFGIYVPAGYTGRLQGPQGRFLVQPPGCKPQYRAILEKGMILEVGAILESPDAPRVEVAFGEFSSAGRAWLEINCPTDWKVFGPKPPQTQTAAAPS